MSPKSDPTPADGAANGMAGLQELLSLFRQAFQGIVRSFDHHDIVAGRLAANHAMHCQETGGFLDRKLPIRAGFDMKMGYASVLLIEEVGFPRANGLIHLWFAVLRLIVSADYFHVHPSGQSLDAASTA